MADPRDIPDFLAYRSAGDAAALARVFDRNAPHLLLVAMHLTRDVDAAEDLLQTTFLQAMQTARDFDPTRPLTPWLIGILTHRAADLHRSDRRTARGLELARELCDEGATPQDPADLVADQEVAAEVTQAIDSLPRHYRQVLILRLLHGLRPVDIAHAQGLSQDTVRSQIRRGLAILRQQLPAGLTVPALAVLLTEECVASARVEVLAAAANPIANPDSNPIANPDSSPVSNPVSSPVSSPVSNPVTESVRPADPGFVGPVPGTGLPRAWGLGLRVAGLAGAAAVAGFAFHALGRADPVASPAHLGAARPAAAPDAASPAAAAAGEAPRAEHAAAAAAAEADRRWRVRWRIDGRPAAGIGVRLRHLEALRGVDPPVFAVTDAEGCIEPPTGAVGEWYLERGIGERITGEAGRAATLWLDPGFTVDGRVVGPDGAGLAGAAVWLSHGVDAEHGHVVTRSDADGRFVLSGVGRRQLVAAAAPGRAWSPCYEVSAPDGACLPLTLSARHPARSLTTTVVDGDGRPVAGAEVWVRCATRPGRARRPDGPMSLDPAPRGGGTDDRGRVTIDALAPGVYEVRARRDGLGLAPARRLTRLGEGAAGASLDLVLEAAGSVCGVVHDAAGQPVAGAYVVGGVMVVLMARTARTDAAGRFRLDGLAPGAVDLHARAATQGRAKRQVRVAGGEVLDLDQPLVLARGHYLAGRVLDDAGAAVAGQAVVVQSAGVVVGGGRTDAAGCFAVCNMTGAPPYELMVEGDDDGPPLLVRRGLQPGATGDLRLDARPSAAVCGRVVTPSGAAPAQARVVLFARSSSWRIEVPVDPATGAFAVARFPPGRTRVAVVSPAHPLLDLPGVDLAGGGTNDLGVLQLAAGGHLRALVHGPRAGARAWLVAARGEPPSGGPRRVQLQFTGDGFATAPAVAPGDYTLHVGATGAIPQAVPVQVRAAATSRVEVRLPAR